MERLSYYYTAYDLCLVIPTKDRPSTIINLLISLIHQTYKPSRIIIIDGGKSISNIISNYTNILPIEHYQCHPPGQIRQRNMALNMLDKRTKLVGYLDDDMVLEPNAIESTIKLFNNVEYNTAGIAFNIINEDAHRYSIFKAALGLSSKKLGAVLKSGYNVPIQSATKNLRISWVPGGATIWKQDVLLKYRQQEIFTRWASCEDLIYSYPIGKIFPLYICCDAKARHEHIRDHTSGSNEKYYGYTETIWRYYFVSSTRELSKLLFIWMTVSIIFGRLIYSFIYMKKRHFLFAIGKTYALYRCIKLWINKGDIFTLLNENISVYTNDSRQ